MNLWVVTKLIWMCMQQNYMGISENVDFVNMRQIILNVISVKNVVNEYRNLPTSRSTFYLNMRIKTTKEVSEI